MRPNKLLIFLLFTSSMNAAGQVSDSSPLSQKAKFFQQDLLEKHWMDGLYISIVPVVPSGQKLFHTVDEPGNVIHSGVWTGRYLAGVGYQYAVTQDPWVRAHGGEILQALRRQQEVTGKPGLLARGYVKGHGPVEGWERNGRDSREWHQGRGEYAGYRWYGDVSVDNFNAVLYGYAIYFDLAADSAQKKIIAHDVDRLMTHLLDNNCRIMDVDGEVTLYGHVGIDPDPARDEYYKKLYASRLAAAKVPADAPWRPALRSSLMLLPDLLIAHHITGSQRYFDFYRKVVDRFRENPDLMRDTRPFSLERLARVDHSSEGQAYEALFNLIRYERDAGLLAKYREWVNDLWEMNWMEGNSLYTYMTLVLTPDPTHQAEALRLANETLRLFPVDRVFRPVMNSIRKEIEQNSVSGRAGLKLSAKPLPINLRPADNEYTWKGNPYQLDGWLKPTVTAMAFAPDDPEVAWFVDSSGRIYMTRDGWKQWTDMSNGLLGAAVRSISASASRTFVLHARTDKGDFITLDGGMSWRTASEGPSDSGSSDYRKWQGAPAGPLFRISEDGELLRSTDGGRSSDPSMKGWRIPKANSFFFTPRGIVASSPGGAYLSTDGTAWTELKLWREEETGAADFLHAYWMGRYYKFVPAD